MGRNWEWRIWETGRTDLQQPNKRSFLSAECLWKVMRKVNSSFAVSRFWLFRLWKFGNVLKIWLSSQKIGQFFSSIEFSIPTMVWTKDEVDKYVVQVERNCKSAQEVSVHISFILDCLILSRSFTIPSSFNSLFFVICSVIWRGLPSLDCTEKRQTMRAQSG